MAFDEALAARIRKQLGKRKGIAEKKMFGGLAFLLNGNMSVGVHADAMIVRLDPEASAKALKQKHTRVFDLSGKPMKGWVLVDPGGTKSDAALAEWVAMGVSYAASLPTKLPKP